MTKKKRGTPLKTCPECQIQLHARKAECGCGYCFYQKRKSVVRNWQELKKGDIVRSLHGSGPYWEDPSTKEKIYMGSYGKFKVDKVCENFIRVFGVGKFGKMQTSSSLEVLYMGDVKKSKLCDNLYNCPHKLVNVSFKGES
jgi:hypothetical protein